ncbi:uncharacterized protein LOC112086103 [Eutrema salsugineum]|uniref:uncharacterized protein LOC112086103 n=1 Tax=Eutrema salsugineum TaxID=72664 RepID=UPI000CED7424|nr:uncharacterized protein LOC112086103 [Eutrema salsugineum]
MPPRKTHYINFKADGHSLSRTSASGNTEIPSSSGAFQVPNMAAEQSPPPPPPPPPPPAPEPCPLYPYARYTVEDLLVLPGREGLRRLVIGKAVRDSYWFGLDNCVGRSVSDTIKRYFVEPHYNWGKVSQDIFNTRYKCFLQRWNWDISINEEVWTQFRLKAQKRLVNTVSDWKRKWEIDGDKAKPSLISTYCWNRLNVYWMDPHPQEVAAKCSEVQNQVGPNGRKLVIQHTSDQVPFAGRRLMMADENRGELPPVTKLFEVTHRKKDMTFVDARSEEIYNEEDRRAGDPGHT